MSEPSSPGPSAAAPTTKPTSTNGGTSVFPTARVSKIIKADRDVDICSKEATLLISIATELFLKKLADEAYTNAKLDKHKHIFYKDLSRAVQQIEYLEFLKDAIPTPMALSSALDARQRKLQQKHLEENMILEGTLEDDDEEEEEEAAMKDGEEESASKATKSKHTSKKNSKASSKPQTAAADTPDAGEEQEAMQQSDA
ncbi:related to DPB3-third-largest subunit of DNA polymerase II [Ustilago bromivora]|uniref:Related to DPB3 - third-largest subunit of DNA polymerase II n=1 Tax=Ustilago bromivora TaxID=307758 RepID=A0A1K0HBS4_9BASI|nr:related to DPB3-third-largest subunit of DNA polymerase II [Ustilago bromivora]SYW75024.1 related to DPB3 - third-largest subunit of DNA polymerase II [Ustilago bromivora]